MYPIICKIGPFTVYSYGSMLALAFIVGAALAATEAQKQGFNPEIIFSFSFLVVICGVAGARILYVLENIAYYATSLREVFMFQYGGLSWYGGFLSGIVCGIGYLKKKRQPVYLTLDLIAPFLALGQAIGRIGCLLNGCCYGKVTRFGVYFPAHQATLIPTQAYSCLLLLFIFIILRFRQERPHNPGGIFFLYLSLYSLKRFFIEFFRADNAIVFAGSTWFQIFSIIALCVGVSGLLLKRKS